MTDKEQIIINGVDVSDCEYLTYQLEEDGQYYWFCDISPAGGPDECKYKPECSYKKVFNQLARKSQECEELKEYLQANQPTGICEICTAEVISQNDRCRKALEEIEKYCIDQNLKYDYTACEILNIINKAKGKKFNE